MNGWSGSAERSRRVPEVLQSSLTDCGPAALKAILEGFGIHASYDVLRERCQTEVDGTSIDRLADLARELGLECEQILVPDDHFLLPEARCLPALVVTRSGGGLLHFVVVWRRWGRFVEVMDPGSGRRWQRARSLLAEVPALPIPISTERFRRWAGSRDAQRPWCARLRALGISARRARDLLELARHDPSWVGFARLDAALRMVTTLVRGGALERGREAEQMLLRFIPASSTASIPDRFRWVRASATSSAEIVTHGMVILRFSGKSRPGRLVRSGSSATAEARPSAAPAESNQAPVWSSALPRAVSAELAAPTLRPLRVLWALLRSRARHSLFWLAAALLASAALVPIEALVLRALLDMDRHLSLGYQQLAWLGGVLVLVGAGLWLDLWSGRWIAHMGRELETRVRSALLERLPLLDDRYLKSRSSSDMASRAHSLHVLRTLPTLWAQLARSAFTVVALTGTLIWLYPEGQNYVCALALTALAVPLCGRRALTEQSLRLHTQAAALDRFYLDTLLGATPVRVHGAQRSIQIAHEQLLTEWAITSRRLHRDQALLQGLQIFATTASALSLIYSYLTESGETTRLLLLAFLALRLPVNANELTSAEFALRTLRSVALRALAPLAAPVSVSGSTEPSEAIPPAHTAAGALAPKPGVHVSLQHVTVVAGGNPLLLDIHLEIASGEHVGIVGASGAGKSSLLGLLLGWLGATEGSVSIDGRSLDAERLRELRNETAWVDPAIQLWEQSLLDNLAYGDDERIDETLPPALSGADLLEVLERQPEGLQSNVGEGGARLSGGQGQRVRLGRAFMRRQPRLVLLDEPFRGLERERRRELLRRARQHWQKATLLLVSHDVDDTNELDRVVVIEGGRVVEVGDPRALLQNPESRYASLSQRARALRQELWSAAEWRKLSVVGGRVSPTDSAPTSPAGARDA